MTPPHHRKHSKSRGPPTIVISTPVLNRNNSPISFINKNSSRSFSFLRIPPANPNFFSKTSMIQLGYGVWINMTTLVTGLAIGFTAVALPQMQHEDSKIKITLSQAAWIASLLTLCVPLGSLIGGIIMDTFGRQPVLAWCGVPVSLGWFLIGLAEALNTFIIGCFILSVGLGMMLTAPRTYIAEITLPNMRGVIGAMPFFFLSFGFMTAATLVVFIEWQTISYICGIYSIILMTFNCYLPETPHFVLLSSPEKAIDNLRRFRSKAFDVETEMEMLLDYRNENDIRRLSFRETIAKMFTHSVCKPFAISLSYILLMLCSGCIVVIMWTGEMLEMSNAAIVASLGNLIICVTRILVGIMTSALLYTAKRRVMAVISATGVGLSALCISVYLHTQVGKHITPFYFYMAYISFAVLGYYTLPLITMYEILPLQLRGVLSGINITLMNLIIFVMNTGYPYIIEAIGLANLMAIFGGISLIGSIILSYILPETSEVTLQEIEEYFRNKRPTLVSSRAIRSSQFISMMRASTSQVKGEMTPHKTTSMNKIRSTENKQKSGQNIVNVEGSKQKTSERNKDEGGSKDEISDALSDILSKGTFDESVRTISTNKEAEIYTEQSGSHNKTFEREKVENDVKDKGCDINSDQEGSIHKKSDTNVDKTNMMRASTSQVKGEMTPHKTTLMNKIRSTENKQKRGQNIVNVEGSKQKTSERNKDEGGLKDEISDALSDILPKGTFDESVRTISTNKEAEIYTEQSGSHDKTFEREKVEDDVKDKGCDINSDQEGSIH